MRIVKIIYIKAPMPFDSSNEAKHTERHIGSTLKLTLKDKSFSQGLQSVWSYAARWN